MNITIKEGTLAWVLGGAVGVCVLAYAWFNFYYKPRAGLESQITRDTKTLNDGRKKIDQSKSADKKWAELKLNTNGSDEAERLMEEMLAIAGRSGINIQSFAQPVYRPVARTELTEVRTGIRAEGTTKGIAHFLKTLEERSLPLRINDVGMRTKREGFDELVFEMTVSAIIYQPRVVAKAPARATTGPATQAGRGTTQQASRNGSAATRGSDAGLSREEQLKRMEDEMKRARLEEDRVLDAAASTRPTGGDK